MTIGADVGPPSFFKRKKRPRHLVEEPRDMASPHPYKRQLGSISTNGDIVLSLFRATLSKVPPIVQGPDVRCKPTHGCSGVSIIWSMLGF